MICKKSILIVITSQMWEGHVLSVCRYSMPLRQAAALCSCMWHDQIGGRVRGGRGRVFYPVAISAFGHYQWSIKSTIDI